MSFFFKKPAVRVLARHTTRHPYFAGEHLFFQVKDSTGVLRMELSRDPDCADVMQDTYLTLTIKGQPLAFIQTSGCPTCQSLLGAGYGLPKDTPELRQAADAIAAPFSGLEEALKRLSPIIGLLPPQYYLLSLVNCCPTDGNGHFFWDIPNEYTSSPATAQTYDPETYTCLPVFPRFLHPTQSTETYDREQAERYRQRIREGKPLPPALAYSAFEYLSILLDGHHRACACALEGVLLPCLILSPARFVGRDDHWQVVWPDPETDVLLYPLSGPCPAAKARAAVHPPLGTGVPAGCRPVSRYSGDGGTGPLPTENPDYGGGPCPSGAGECPDSTGASFLLLPPAGS